MLQLIALLVACVLLYLSVLTAEDNLDQPTRSLVAARNPFRETGPPANMAQLLLLRQKIQTTNRRRPRSPSHPRQLRPLNQNLHRQPSPWTRLAQKAFRRTKQYH